jgi:hypothetical protein
VERRAVVQEDVALGGLEVVEMFALVAAVE